MASASFPFLSFFYHEEEDERERERECVRERFEKGKIYMRNDKGENFSMMT
jgi:uncharacterized membrane protein YkgB